MRKSKVFRYIIFLVPLPFLLAQCLINPEITTDQRGPLYAGSSSCQTCHKSAYRSYIHTAHYMASASAGKSTIQGSFANGRNKFDLNPHVSVFMEKRDSGFFQTSYVNGKKEQSQRFDVVFGAVKGQTYAYWLANELFQLPVSYVANTNSWINSPGYDSTNAVFARGISTRCLDCHMSFAKTAPPELPGFYEGVEGFDKQSLIMGIDCERCHGPAAAHVKFQTDNPEEKEARYIKRFSSLTRQQKINVCAICHSGATTKILKPTFSFKPGDSLSDYMVPYKSAEPKSYTHIDVHGNQAALLASSKCFKGSPLVCSTCHNTHVSERSNLILFATKCLSCHEGAYSFKQCKLTNKLSAAALISNCISCHMPAFASKTIIAGQVPTLIHTHHIGVYKDEAQKILAYIKKTASK